MEADEERKRLEDEAEYLGGLGDDDTVQERYTLFYKNKVYKRVSPVRACGGRLFVPKI